MKKLYPLLFNDDLHPVLWGGSRLKALKGVSQDDTPIGESWEVSAVKGSLSIVKNGPLSGMNLEDLTKEYGPLLVGEEVYRQYGDEFPILAKFIDARKDLSIQVHPNDITAHERHNKNGKTEMWYVIDCEPDSFLYAGFSEQISQEEYVSRVEDGTITDVLAKHPVHPGDVFYIPCGRVHAIGAGIFLAEIQRSSDVTYRIYDFDRIGLDGKKRELHTELAKDVVNRSLEINYRSYYERRDNKPMCLVHCPFFVVDLLEMNKPIRRNLIKYDTFIIYMCVKGDCCIKVENSRDGGLPLMGCREIFLREGSSCLVPASVADVSIIPQNDHGTTRILETYIDNQGM